MKKWLFILVGSLLGHCTEDMRITRRSDYAEFLTAPSRQEQAGLQNGIEFWTSRLLQNGGDPTSKQKLALLYAEKFKRGFNSRDIHYSDSLLKSLLTRRSSNHAALFRSLAHNAMSRHDFQEAERYTEKAIAFGDDVGLSNWIAIDLASELGLNSRSEKMLGEIKNDNSFQYLIRKARLLDSKGDLNGAIGKMEQARERISGNDRLLAWVLSTLGDMYGHAGRVRESYQSYLLALRKDRTQWYPLKGIAWIAFSHDHDSQKAKEIIEFLTTHYTFPEGNLFMAEIENLLGDEGKRYFYLDQFVSATQDSLLARMFARHRALILADEYEKADESISVARDEVRNRPNAMSYDLLAWGFFRKGDERKALEIASRYVEGQCFEPVVLYHLGKIYQANGLRKESRKFLKQALSARFEMGPVLTHAVENALAQKSI